MNGERDPKQDATASEATASETADAKASASASASQRDAEGFRLESPSSGDWALETTQRPLPPELLAALRHPDVPGVVLDAITLRSTPPPGNVQHPSIADSPDEDTARYMLGPAVERDAVAVPVRARSQHVHHEIEDSLASAWLVGVAFGGVVLAWLSFGLLGR